MGRWDAGRWDVLVLCAEIIWRFLCAYWNNRYFCGMIGHKCSKEQQSLSGGALQILSVNNSISYLFRES